jgi:hypothetical protein
MTRTLRTWLSDTFFELAVRLAPRVEPAKLEPPKFASTPWPQVTITHPKVTEPALTSGRKNDTGPQESPLPELLYVPDPNQLRAAEKLRTMANDVEIGVVRSFHAVWHGGPCELHAFVQLPPNAGDA